ncbi:MAG: Xaa-Pro peptidase family protein [Gemmatimonadota bacterium]
MTQPIAAQSDAAFSPDVYAARRSKLISETRAVTVVPGRLLAGADDNNKQKPDFWYLTGVESPFAVIVLVPRRNATPRSILFLPEPYQLAGGQYPALDEGFRRAVWNRPRRRLAPGDAAIRATGVDETHPIDSLVPRLRALVGSQRVVYAPLGGEPGYAPPGLRGALSFAAQFTASLKAVLPPEIDWRDVTPAIHRLRLVKDASEISALRKAAELSALGMLEGLRALRPGMNDRELAGLMEFVWKREGSPRAAFPPIVSSGENALTFFSLLRENYNAVDRIMRAGDLVFVDYGAAEYRTYTADLCRTWPVSGRFTPEQRKYYDIVLEAQEAAIAAMRPGAMMLDAIKAAAHVFRKHGLEQYEDIAKMGEDKVWGIMPSPTHYLARDAGIVRYSPLGRGVRDLGHHIGLEVQDSRDYSMPLQPGMVITVEPKIYIPDKNIAIMIEDMILITTSGHENLSAGVPKRAVDIERVMAEGRRTNAWRPGGTVPQR